MNHFMAIEEVEPGQGRDAVAVERGLEGEVEAGQCLDGGEARHLQGRFDPAAFADGDLLGKQRVDRLDRGDLAALELLDDVVEHLQGARHPQADRVATDLLDGGGRQDVVSHAAAPLAARRLPTASYNAKE